MANTAIIDLAKPAGTDHALISVINSNMDKIDAEAGRQRGNFAGTYSTTSGYAVGDYCIYQGNLYRCTTAIGSSGENWTAGHWTSVKVGTELKGLSDQLANKIYSYDTAEISLTQKGTAIGPFTYQGYTTISSDRYIVAVFPIITSTDWIVSIGVHSNRHTVYVNANGSGTLSIGYLYV